MRIWFSQPCSTGFESLAETDRRVENVNRIMRTNILSIKTVLIAIGLLALFAGVSRAADVKENWEKNCASCHGMDGKGKTKAGRLADVKDFTDAKYQEGLKDEQMFKQIKDGMKDKNGKERMKPFGDKLNDEEIKALIKFIREFKK